MNQAQQRRDWIGIGTVAAVAVVARGAVIAAALLGLGPLDHLGEDPDSYRQIAETLSVSGTFGITADEGSVDPTAFRPPLYPWVLSWLTVDGRLGNAAVGMLHWVIGVLTCCGVYAVVSRLTAPPRRAGLSGNRLHAVNRIAVAAGCLTAIDPLLLMQSTWVMTETIAAGLAVAAWWAATRDWAATQEQAATRDPKDTSWGGYSGWGWPLAVGGLLAAGYLCRPLFAVWIVLWIGWLVAIGLWKIEPHPGLGRHGLRRRWVGRQAIAILAVVGVTAAGWMLRNQTVIGKAVWATTHGGYTLLLGNNRFFYDYLETRTFAEAAFWGDAWDAEAFHHDWAQRQAEAIRQAEVDRQAEQTAEDLELVADRLAGELAKQEIRRRPAMFLYASLVRVGRLWSPVPRLGNQVGPVSWAIGVFYGALGIGVVAGLWRLRRRLLSPGWAPPLLLCVAVTAVHAVYWSNLRMRAPVMPMVAAIAAVGLLGNPKSLLHIRDSGPC